jgi:hypothetical protein
MPLDVPDTRARKRRRLPPGLIRAAQAAHWCSVGLRTWRSWDSGGIIPRPIRVSGCVFWSLKTLREWRDFGCPDRRRFEELLAAQGKEQLAPRHAGRLPR